MDHWFLTVTFKTLEDFDRTKSRGLWSEDPVNRQSVDSTEWIEAPHGQPVQELDISLSGVFYIWAFVDVLLQVLIAVLVL